MKVHWTVWLLGIVGIFVLGALFGGWIKRSATIEINTIDTLMVRVTDTCFYPETLIVADNDTFFITDSTPIGEVPVRLYVRNDSLPISLAGERAYIPFTIEIPTRQYYGYNIRTKPMPYPLTPHTTKDRLSWDLGLYAWVDQHKDISITTEGNLVFFKRFVLGTRIEANKDFEVRFSAGVGLRL